MKKSSSRCYACTKFARAGYVCTRCELLLKHDLIGPEEVFSISACALHEAAIDVPLKTHLLKAHEDITGVDLGKSFRREA